MEAVVGAQGPLTMKISAKHRTRLKDPGTSGTSGRLHNPPIQNHAAASIRGFCVPVLRDPCITKTHMQYVIGGATKRISESTFIIHIAF